jgi:hypothetical protein
MHFACEATTLYQKIDDAPAQFPQYTHNLGEKDMAEDNEKRQ